MPVEKGEGGEWPHNKIVEHLNAVIKDKITDKKISWLNADTKASFKEAEEVVQKKKKEEDPSDQKKFSKPQDKILIKISGHMTAIEQAIEILKQNLPESYAKANVTILERMVRKKRLVNPNLDMEDIIASQQDNEEERKLEEELLNLKPRKNCDNHICSSPEEAMLMMRFARQRLSKVIAAGREIAFEILRTPSQKAAALAAARKSETYKPAPSSMLEVEYLKVGARKIAIKYIDLVRDWKKGQKEAFQAFTRESRVTKGGDAKSDRLSKLDIKRASRQHDKITLAEHDHGDLTIFAVPRKCVTDNMSDFNVKGGMLDVFNKNRLDKDGNVVNNLEEDADAMAKKNYTFFKLIEEDFSVLMFFAGDKAELTTDADMGDDEVCKVAVFGSKANRIGAMLHIISACETEAPGFFTKEKIEALVKESDKSIEEKKPSGYFFAEDDLPTPPKYGCKTMAYTADQKKLWFGEERGKPNLWVLRKRLSAAAAVELDFGAEFLMYAGPNLTEATDYLNWHLNGKAQEFETPLKFAESSFKEAEKRKDCMIVWVPNCIMDYVSGASELKDNFAIISREAKCQLFFAQGAYNVDPPVVVVKKDDKKGKGGDEDNKEEEKKAPPPKSTAIMVMSHDERCQMDGRLIISALAEEKMPDLFTEAMKEKKEG